MRGKGNLSVHPTVGGSWFSPGKSRIESAGTLQWKLLGNSYLKSCIPSVHSSVCLSVHPFTVPCTLYICGRVVNERCCLEFQHNKDLIIGYKRETDLSSRLPMQTSTLIF